MTESKHRESTSDKRTPVPDQYDAGYAARFRDEPMCVGAMASWQAGWSDANRELGRFDEAFQPGAGFFAVLRHGRGGKAARPAVLSGVF